MYFSKTIRSTYFLWISVALMATLHLMFLDLPPKSMHIWRQCNTLAMTRNFYEEGMNPFTPRVDNRFDTDGVTGSQFPSFEIGLASIYHLTGEHYWVQRSYCLLLSILGMIGMYLLVTQLSKNKTLGHLAAWTYAWSPLIFYYSISALPDDLALPSSIWGLYLFLRWFEKWVEQRQIGWFWMMSSLFFITLAGLTKIQYLALGFFIVPYILLRKNKLVPLHWIAFVSFGTCCSSICVSWYLYAKYLIAKSGLTDFGLSFKPEDNFKRGVSTLLSNLTQTCPEFLLNYSSFLFLLVGLFFLTKKKSGERLVLTPFLSWSLAFACYHLIELRQMEYHDYYMMAYMPLLVCASTYGAWHLLQTKWQNLIAILLLIQPVLAFARIVPSRFLSKETEDKEVFYQKDALAKLQTCVPKNALCVVGPDDSHCIYFYFLRKKGFGFGEEGISSAQLKEYIKKGARFIYTNKKEIIENQELVPYLDRLMCTERNFYVYSLKIQE
jgi:hypothetical protein